MTLLAPPLSALNFGYRIARRPLRLVENATGSECIGMLAYRCDRVAARLLQDESLLLVDHE